MPQMLGASGMTDKTCKNCGNEVELLVFYKEIHTGLTVWGSLVKNICQTCVDAEQFIEWLAR